MRRLLAAALAVAALSLALVGCGSEDDRLTIYSGRTKDLVGPLLDRFSEETGVKIDVRYGESAELALLIEQEGDRTPADVFLSQSPGAVGFLAGKGRLAVLGDDVLDAVDPSYRSGEGRWVGLSGRVRTLVYNTELVDEADLPSSVFEVTDERFRGDVAVAPSNGSFQDFVSGLRESKGDEAALAWLKGMVANDAPTYANNVAIVQAVARGEVPMGLVNHYYNARQLAENPGSPTRNYFFEEGDIGSLLLVTAASLVEGTDQREDAERLIQFLLGEDAQTFFSEETFEYPLASGVEPAADLPPLEDVVALTIDLDRLGGDLERTRKLIAESGLEAS